MIRIGDSLSSGLNANSPARVGTLKPAWRWEKMQQVEGEHRRVKRRHAVLYQCYLLQAGRDKRGPKLRMLRSIRMLQ